MPSSQLGHGEASQDHHFECETKASGQLQDFIPDGSYQRVSRRCYVTSTKLNATNYWSWKKIAQLQLTTMNLWALVNGEEPQPDIAVRPHDFKAWIAHDTQAQLWIRRNIEGDQYTHLDDAASAKDIWDCLKQAHRSWANLIWLKRILIKYKATPGSSVEEIAGELTALQMSISAIKASEAPSDLDLALRLMDSVKGKEYAEVKLLLEEMPDLTFKYARLRLHNVDWRKEILGGRRFI